MQEVSLIISSTSLIQEVNTETKTKAQYYAVKDSHYFIFEEALEGFSLPFHSRLKLKGKKLELKRQGEVEHIMLFEEGKQHFTSYATPFGTLPLYLTTKEISVKQTPEEFVIMVEYTMDYENEKLDSCRLNIVVKELE